MAVLHTVGTGQCTCGCFVLFAIYIAAKSLGKSATFRVVQTARRMLAVRCGDMLPSLPGE